MNHTINGVTVTTTGDDLHDIFAQLGHTLLPELTDAEIMAADVEEMATTNNGSDVTIARRNKVRSLEFWQMLIVHTDTVYRPRSIAYLTLISLPGDEPMFGLLRESSRCSTNTMNP